MAVRENHKRPEHPFVLFVVMTTALFVSTFMLFSKYDEERPQSGSR